MSRFQHRADLVEIPRPLVNEVVHSLLDALEGVPFPDGRLETGTDATADVRLVEGAHLTAGARYRIVPPDTGDVESEVRIDSWDRAGTCRATVSGDIDGHTVTARVELRMTGRRPDMLRIEGEYQGPGPGPLRVLQRAKWEAEARLEDWFTVLGQRSSPITLRIRHPLAQASLQVDRGKDEEGRWAAESTLRFGGRGIARPFTALPLLIMRGRIRRLLSDAFGRFETGWNGAVPGMVERGLQEKITLRHEVEVAAVPREWAEEYVAALHRAIGELPFKKGRLEHEDTDVRLVDGAHIEAGAGYRICYGDDDPLDVKVTAWDLDGPNRVEFGGTGDVDEGWAELDSAARPALIRGALSGEIEEFKQVDCAAEGDLERWWKGVGGSGAGDPAFTSSVRHPLGESGLSIGGAPAAGDRWAVAVTLTVEGRDWTRPLLAVIGMVGATALHNSVRSTVDKAAEDWNRTIPKITKSEPASAAETTLHQLLDQLTHDD